MHAPPAPAAERVYFAEVHEQPFPQLQLTTQVQRAPQRQGSALVQPQVLFSQRQSFWDVMVCLLIRCSRRCCLLSMADNAGPVGALHRARRRTAVPPGPGPRRDPGSPPRGRP